MSKENAIELAQAIQNAKEDGESVYFFIGAGCSLKANIPLAGKIVKQINDKYPNKLKTLDDTEKQSYQHCMGKLSKEARKNLIKSHVDKSIINWAHIALSVLMQKGYVQRTLSFNFDNVLRRACALLGEHPAIYDFTSGIPALHSLISDPAIVHLHGQSDGFDQVHDKGQSEDSAENQKDFTRQILKNAICVFIGYSGEADSFFDVIAEVYDDDHDLYWVGIEDKAPKNVQSKLLDHHRSAQYLSCEGADEFLVDVVNELDIFPPDFIANPYQHLHTEFNKIGEFPGEWGKAYDAMHNIKTQLLKDAEGHKENREADLNALLVADKFQTVIDIFEDKEPVNDNEKYHLSWAFVLKGLSLTKQEIKDKNDLVKVVGCYQQALKVDARRSEAFNNWGTALSDIADKTADVDDARELSHLACEKYQKAVEIKPEDYNVLYNWANTLDDIADKTTNTDDAIAFYQQACKKYQKAVEIEPDDNETLFNWGCTIEKIADRTKDKDNVLAIYQQACEKYEQALDLMPEDTSSLTNLSTSQLKILHLVDESDKANLFASIYKQLQKQITIEPDELYNFACYHSLRGEFEEAKVKLQHCKDKDTLPENPKTHLVKDKDLQLLREAEPEWFQDFIDSLPEEE